MALEPVDGDPGAFRMSNGEIVHIVEHFPRFISVRTPWEGRPPTNSEWIILDIRTTDEDFSGTIRVTDAERNALAWEADKRVLAARDLAVREIMPEMRDAAAYLGGVAETMREFTYDASPPDLVAMTEALNHVTAAWARAYRMITQTHEIPAQLLHGNRPKIYKIDCDAGSCELHLVVIERRPVR